MSAAPVVRRQSYVQLPPARIFGPESVVLHGRLDTVLLVASSDGDTVDVAPLAGDEVAAHMRASLEEERAPLMQAYRQFRYLFPERRSAVVEQAAATEQRLLERYLGDRPAHLLRHPYPVRLDLLVPPVESVLPEPA